MAYIPVEKREKTETSRSYIPVAERAFKQTVKERLPLTMGGLLRQSQFVTPKKEDKQFSFSVGAAEESQTPLSFDTTSSGSTAQSVRPEDVGTTAKIMTGTADALTFLPKELSTELMRFGKSAVYIPRSALESIGAIEPKERDKYGAWSGIETYQEGVRRRVSEGDNVGMAILKTIGQVLLEEPVGYSFKPVFFGLGMLWKGLRTSGKESFEQFVEGVARSDNEDDITMMILRASPDVPESEAKILARELAQVTDKNDVRKIVQEAGSKIDEDITKGLEEFRTSYTEESVPAVARTADEAAPAIAKAKATDDLAQAAAEMRRLAQSAVDMKQAGKTFDEFVERFPESGVYKDTPKTREVFTQVREDVTKIVNLPRVFDDIVQNAKKGDDILGKLQKQVDEYNKKYDTNYEALDLLKGGTDERTLFNEASTVAYKKAGLEYDTTPLREVWNRAPTTRAPQPRTPTPTRTVPSGTANTVAEQARRTGDDATETATDQVIQATQKSDSYNVTIKDGDKEVKTNIGTPEDKVKASPEEMDEVASLVWKDNISISTSRAAGVMVPERNLAKEIEANIIKHSNKIPDNDVASARNELLLNEETVADILARKRGIITDAESIRRAAESKATMEQVLNVKKGTALNSEQVNAVKQIVQNAREEFTGLRKLLDGGGIAQTKDERALLKRLGLEDASEMKLINEAMIEKQIELRKAEAVLYAAGSEAGRALRSYGRFVEGIELRMRTVLSKLKGLPEEERAAIIESISRLDLNDNKTFINTLEQFNKADWADKIAEYMVAVKLWNPTTHIVNTGGNFVRQGADLAIKTVTNPTVAMADWAGAATGIRQGLRNAMRALTNDGYARNLSKFIEAGGDSPAIKGMKGRIIRYPFQLLAAGDELFRAIAYNRSMYRQAFIAARKDGLKGADLNARMKQILESPSYEQMARATDEAKRMTFQDDIGEIISTVNKLRTPSAMKSWYGKLSALGVRAFLPFLKTPANLFKQSLDFSPVGLLKNNKALREAVKNGDREKVGTIIGEATLGTAMMYVIYEQFHQGNVTGGAPRESSKKDAFYREKKLPYAIKIGDTWVQYKRVDPFATMLGLVADVETLRESGEDVSVGSVAYMLSQQLSDKTYLQGVNDFMNMIGLGEPWEAEYAWKSALLGGALPSIIGHAARSMDPTVRDAKSLGERAQAIIPGMSEDLPAKVNVLGYDIQRANKGLNYFFNPIQTETAYVEPVTRELMKINKMIAVPSTSFSRDGVKYELTPQEYEIYARSTGTRLHDELDRLFKTSKYKRASNEDKDKMIEKIRRDIQDEYKDEYIKRKTRGAKSSRQSSTGGNWMRDALTQ